MLSWQPPELIDPSSEAFIRGLAGFIEVEVVVALVVVVVVVEVVVVVLVVVLVGVLVFVSGDVVFDFSPPKNTFQRGTWSLASSCMPRG